jgi:hypothetical protein
MIVNHRYRFIFLKTKKTAGTSTEIALSRYCDGNDILSKIGHRDEPKRAALGYQGPANNLEPAGTSLLDRFRRWRHGPEERFWNHMSAAELRQRIGPDIWNSYFKFCFERNPWDRAISAYYWENRSRSEWRMPNFYRYLRKLERWDMLSNFNTYAIDGEIAVDAVYRYEDIGTELDRLVQRIGLPGDLRLPDAKRGARRDRRPYQEFYSDRERDLVARACAREISEFGYSF